MCNIYTYQHSMFNLIFQMRGNIPSYFLGIASNELKGKDGMRGWNKLPLNWSEARFREHILQLYPTISADFSVGFSKKINNYRITLFESQYVTPQVLKDSQGLIGRSQIYIIPKSLKADASRQVNRIIADWVKC